MAIFFQSYIYIPESDRKKTTLRQGNPHRLDHYLLGAVACQASLYKPPKTPQVQSFWLWDDPAFDIYDTQPSEYILTKNIFDLLNREMERVQQDNQVNFRQHFVVGEDLLHQLSFLHQRALHLHINSPEILYYTFIGATPIELGSLTTGRKIQNKPLKPLYLPNEIKNIFSKSLLSTQQLHAWYASFEIDKIENQARSDITLLMDYYHHLRVSS